MRKVLPLLVALFVVGLLGVTLAVLIGFEEPPRLLFALSTLCVLAPALILLLHLSMTKELSRAEKTFWLRGLFSRKALQFASAYLAKLQA